jgi:hypothetical protein
VHPLSRFLRLHALLHPAQSSDHDQLTFGRLTLPFALRDEVQATDVLRVGRMHEDLLAGGDAGKGVIGGLAKGSAGDDEESEHCRLTMAEYGLIMSDDHVHHLVHLFDQPESEQERQADASRGESDSNPVADPSEAGETEVEPVPEVIPPVSRTQSDRSMPNGHSEEDPAAASMALNFLQDDELEANIEDSYEVVPMLEPHEVCPGAHSSI